jgi:site-specific DNA-methyltransferase (adenine-specific)
MSKCEIASYSRLRKVEYFRHDWSNTDKYNTLKGTDIHPCQKPVALYEWLLMNYAKEGDRILDTHLGSGSIAIACHNLGFDLVGCELDEDYYNAACERLDKHKRQLRMF